MTGLSAIKSIRKVSLLLCEISLNLQLHYLAQQQIKQLSPKNQLNEDILQLA